MPWQPGTGFPKPVFIASAGNQPAPVRTEFGGRIIILDDVPNEFSSFHLPNLHPSTLPSSRREPLAIRTEADVDRAWVRQFQWGKIKSLQIEDAGWAIDVADRYSPPVGV
jgi:hypothetical protein